MEEKGIQKLGELTRIPLEKLSQKERLKASRVKETIKELLPKNSEADKFPQLQLIVPFSPILKSSLQKISYCLIDRPKISPGLNRDETKQLLVELIEKLRVKMALPMSFRNLFTKNCQRVTSICEVIEGDYTFFLTPLPNLDTLFHQSSNRATEAIWKFRFLKEVVEPMIRSTSLNTRWWRVN
jgi:hypothetical protein